MLCRGTIPWVGGFRAGPGGVARRLERRRRRRRLTGSPRGSGAVPVPPGWDHRVGEAQTAGCPADAQLAGSVRLCSVFVRLQHNDYLLRVWKHKDGVL